MLQTNLLGLYLVHYEQAAVLLTTSGGKTTPMKVTSVTYMQLPSNHLHGNKRGHESQNETCPVCMDTPVDPRALKGCGHVLCRECLVFTMKQNPVCLICGKIYGILTGSQPPGMMNVKTTSISLPVVQRVVSHSPHQVAGQTLTVALFCPPLQKPCYENRVLVQRLNSAVTEELLTNFLENETGMKVMEFLYGEEEGKVVVTFANCIDFAALRKACSKRKIEGTFLQVVKVAISNCIFVKNLQPSASHEFILFYFENKRSGVGKVERVEMSKAERYCLVYFVDHEVIETVLCQQHRIDGAVIKVHLHHECLGRRSSRSRSDPFLKMSKPEMKDDLLKAETSSSVSSNPDKGCDFVETSDFVETPKWQEDDGKNCVLSLWIKYKKASERTIIRDMKKVPCSWNFHVFWNFFTKTKQGQHLLDDILKKCDCSVTVSSDDDNLFIFEISDKRFENKSEVIDFIKDALGNVYACAQQSLCSDIFLIDHRMLEDILQRVKHTKELDSAWIELVGKQEPGAICVLCTEKDKASILQVMTAIKADVQECFENHEDAVTIDPMWQKVMKKLGYLQKMNEKFPDLTITPNETKSHVMLKGPRDQSNAAAEHLVKLLGTALAEVQEAIFSPGCQFEIFAYPEMCDYIDNSIIKLPIVCTPNHLAKKIHLFSKKSEQIMGMDKFIKGCIKERLYPLPKDKLVCCRKIASSLEELKKKHKGKIVINQSSTGLLLTTTDDIFESVDATVQEIISMETGNVQPEEKQGKRENIKRTEDSLQSKKDVTSEQTKQYPIDLRSEPDANFDKQQVMVPPKVKVKPNSDGIDKMEDRKWPDPVNKIIKIAIEKGQLHEAQTEVLVNKISTNLDLTNGTISSSLLKKAGPALQIEIKKNWKPPIPVGVVLKTAACQLSSPCKAVYHGALKTYHPKDDSVSIFQRFLLDCQQQASKSKYKSIAFPGIGTGNLSYPKDVVASLMLTAVIEFEKSMPNTSLEEVKFVIHPDSTETYQAFKNQLQNLHSGHKDGSEGSFAGNTVIQQYAVSPAMSQNELPRPSHWVSMKATDILQVALDPKDTQAAIRDEFSKVKGHFDETMSHAQIFSIKRIQNALLWAYYTLAKKCMEKKAGGVGFANEMHLYHGTKPDLVDLICQENFNFRLSGDNVGAILGHGTNFVSEAQTSDVFAATYDKNHKFMSVAKVLVGKTCLGNPNYKKPPYLDDKNNNVFRPTIYCVFDRNQYYPEYLVEYKV